MKFQQWLKLNESGNFRFDEPVGIGNDQALYIDMRAEDWEMQSRELRHPESKEWHDALHLKKILPASQFATIPSFYGRTPDGRFIYHRSGDIGKVMLSDNEPNDLSAINLDTLPLKRSWWDYVEIVDPENTRVKKPGRIRPTDTKVA